MNPLRSAAAFLAFVAFLAPVAVAAPVETSPSAENAAAAPATPASVALALQGQITQLIPLTASPSLAAGKIASFAAGQGATPSQALAAQYLYTALTSPKSLPVVLDFVARSQAPGAERIGARLALIAAPYRANTELRQSLVKSMGRLSQLQFSGLQLGESDLKRSLDRLFENAKAGRTAQAAVDTRGPPESGAKISLQLGKAAPGQAAEDPVLARLKKGFLNRRRGDFTFPEEVRAALADPGSAADVDLEEVRELEEPQEHAAAPASPKVAAAQAKLLAGPLAQPEFKPDFVDIGMGPTGMMAILAAVASGRTAVGVEMRGKPTRGVHQNIREEWFHTLALIDQKMAERYGEEGVPKLANGKPWKLADYFYNAERPGGRLDFPDLYPSKEPEQAQNVAGRLTRVMFEDARDGTLAANGGKAKLYVLPPPVIPERADPTKVRGDMKVVLDSPSVFQVALINYELMLRSYLKAMEIQDKRAGRKPRVKLYESHRVAQDDGDAVGYLDGGQGRRRIVIEEVQEAREGGGKADRVRKPGSMPIDLGTPVRFALTAGYGGGADAKALGYQQEDVLYHDPTTNQQVAGRQNWISGEVTANIGGQLLRRISTAVDPVSGKRETLRQIAVGHEQAPNVAWILAQVPDFTILEPVAAGKVPAGTDPKSPQYKAAAQEILRDYYIAEVSKIVHIPEADIRRMRMFYGPSLFTLQERIGKTGRLASNGNVAGDLMGNGHFLTSGGAMTGMIGHTACFLQYWNNLANGMPEAQAARELEKEIRRKSEAWLHVSAKEFFDLLPANFGEDRAAAINANSADITDAGKTNQSHGVNHGLTSILGQSVWAESFRRLRNGEFGQAGKDFYVPDQEVDLTRSPDVVVQRVDLPPKK